MFGNITLLIAFFKQYKTEKPYMYQFLLTVSKTLEIFTTIIAIATYLWWSNAIIVGAKWFTKNYPLMWDVAHLSLPVANGFMTSSVLFSMAMAGDRVFALSQPFKYKSHNHKFYHKMAGVICFAIGISTSIFDCFRHFVVPEGDSYKILIDVEYLNTNIAQVLVQLRTLVRVAAIFVLIGLNIAMTIIFRKRSKKVGQMSSNSKKEQERKESDKTLLLLTAWQSFLTCFGEIPETCWYIAAYAVPGFATCWGTLMASFSDAALYIADAADFFVVMAINKKLRRTICEVLPTRFRCGV